MGVSGSGKSTVGAALAQRLGVPFADADAFHPAANISVEGEWNLYAPDGSELDRSRPSPRQEAFQLHRLLGQRVAASTVSSPNWIALRFEAGELLRISDSSKEYESFSIQPGNIFI